MAQAKVSDYFSAKKRSQQEHPTKKRKIDYLQLETETNSIAKTVSKSDQTAESRLELKSKQTPRKQLNQNASLTRSTNWKRHDVGVVGQVKIKDAFGKASGSSSDTDGQEVPGKPEPSDVTEEVASYWDEHNEPRTPKRKTRPMNSFDAPLSDSRETKSTRRLKILRHAVADDSVTPTKDSGGEGDKAARGKALAQSFQNMIASESRSAELGGKDAVDSIEKIVMPLESPGPSSKGKRSVSEDWTNKASETDIQTPPCEDQSQFSKPGLLNNAADKTAPSSVSHKLNKKKVITPKAMQERLSKCGKLDTLKAKLAEMNSSLRTLETKRKERETGKAGAAESAGEITVTKTATPSTAVTEKKISPAYERYEHLARDGPPSLTLPGKYQRLLTMFQGTDTVVSMLFNRQEIITFSKLQTAVQSMTRKNFEQKTLGQIKTVYPDAYNFRQEKGLPSFGNKVSGYQLTVEPNLDSCSAEETRVAKGEKPVMSAQTLVKRKRIFHNSLVSLTKDHHAAFLSKQKKGVEVQASKLTRWHPQFPLDSVPEVETAELPTPPEIKVQTAKQVLDLARGKLPARVENALAKVAMKSEESKPATSTSAQQKPAPNASTASPASAKYRNIPLDLLEKIRAKQAAKEQAAMTRDPEEDKKTVMIERLPNLIRSMRTFFVTEKKPSLPFRTVVDKLADSYETFISHGEVEAHLALLQEMYPKWLQVIQITRGKFVKIDKNMDIATMMTELANLAKSRR